MEEINYSILFRWFSGLSLDEPIWSRTTFSKNRDSLVEDGPDGVLNDFVFQCRDAERAVAARQVSAVGALERPRPIRSPMHTAVKVSHRVSRSVSKSVHVTPSTPGAAARFRA
jgi:hypothetical protein